MSDVLMTEAYRPQYHFSAPTGWLNDPNGLVYYGGEYHLFYQHNPASVNWGNMTWGHAVSRDLLHWEHLPHAITPDEHGTIFSGSAVVDWRNDAGFGREALLAFYTAAGECVKPAAPTTQRLAYSTDRGRTWTKYAGNPILPQITPGNRDPKVFFHAGSEQWLMVLYVPVGEEHSFQILGSRDLKSWRHLSSIEGFYECPDLFPLGDAWVLFAADGQYAVGDFDGQQFTPRGGKYVGDWGPNFYAAQTYSDIPASDGRRLLIGWLRGGRYPQMPFNQQMTIPCELTLRDGRLQKWPVRELASLTQATHESPDFEGELCDLEAEIEPGNALACGFELRGYRVTYLVGEQVLYSGQHAAPLPLVHGRFKLRLLLDRASIEVFANEGRVVLSAAFLPEPARRRIRFFSTGGQARLVSLQVRELRSVWPVVPA